MAVSRVFRKVPSSLLMLPVLAWVAWVQYAQWPAPSSGTFVYQDMAVYATAGWLWTEGWLPYRDFWDHKPPLVHAINAVGVLVSGGALWGPWLTSLLALETAAVLSFIAMRRLGGVWWGLTGAALWTIGLAPVLEAGNLTEVYALPLQWASLVLLGHERAWPRGRLRRGFAAGLCLALAALVRPNLTGTTFAVAATLVLCARGQRLRTLAGAALGVAVPLAFAGAWLSLNGIFADFWDQVVVYNRAYSEANGALHRMKVFGRHFQVVPLAVTGWLGLGRASVTMLVVAVVGLARLFRPSGERSPDQPGLSPPVIAAFIAIPLETAFAMLSGRLYFHYFMALLPPLTLGSYLLARKTAPSRWNFLLAIPWLLLVVTVVVVFRVFPGAVRLQPLRPDIALYNQASAYLREHTRPGDRVFLWGMFPGCLFEAKRLPASRFYYLLPLLQEGYCDEAVVGRLIAGLEANPPVLVLDQSGIDFVMPPLAGWDRERAEAWRRVPPALRRFPAWFHERYRPAGTLANGAIQIYEPAPMDSPPPPATP